MILSSGCGIMKENRASEVISVKEDFVLDRSLYKTIKNMNKEKMSGFLNDIYYMGVRDASADSVNMDTLREKIGGIKGIGESRLNEIMDVIVREINGE